MRLFQFSNVTNTKRFAAAAALAALIALVAYGTEFWQIRTTNRQISASSNEIDLVLQKEIRLRSLQNIIKESEEGRRELESYFVGEDAVVDFIETIEGLGDISGTSIDITSVSVDEIENDGAVSQAGELLRLNFDAKGGWKDLVHLLTLAEALPFAVNVEHVNLTSMATAPESAGEVAEEVLSQWNGTFGITVVKQKQPTP